MNIEQTKDGEQTPTNNGHNSDHNDGHDYTTFPPDSGLKCKLEVSPDGKDWPAGVMAQLREDADGSFHLVYRTAEYGRRTLDILMELFVAAAEERDEQHA